MRFAGWFFVLVLVLGYAELRLLFGVSGSLGFSATLGLCVLTGIVGGALVRSQGLRTLQKIQAGMARGQVPAREVIGGLVLLLVGVLLILPGFITDVLGFLMLIPPLRLLVAGLLARLLQHRVTVCGPATDLDPLIPGTRRRRIIDVEPEE